MGQQEIIKQKRLQQQNSPGIHSYRHSAIVHTSAKHELAAFESSIIFLWIFGDQRSFSCFRKNYFCVQR